MAFFKLLNISKKYQNQTVLDDISFSLPRNGLIVIKGKSGCGKSTLLNIIFGIVKPDKGKVLINDKNITKLKDKDFASFHTNDISFIYQHYNLIENLSALENVMIPLLIKGEKINKSKTKAIELFDRFNILYLKDQLVSHLSGGEKQRIAILRSLITDCPIILADEPTGALDTHNKIIVMNMLKIVSLNHLVIMVSHDENLVSRYADIIICLAGGKIKEEILLNKTNDKAITPNKKQNIGKEKASKLIIKSHFKQNRTKNFLSILSTCFGILCLFICFGISNGFNISRNQVIYDIASISYANISNTTYYKIDNSSLSFEKSERPKNDECLFLLELFDSIQIVPNIEYFINPINVISFNGNDFENIYFCPLGDLSLIDDLLIKNSSEPSSFPIYINKNLYEKLDGEENIFLETINFINKVTIKYKTRDENNPFIKENIDISLKGNVRGVINEFSFLETPTIYYEYSFIKQYLEEKILKKASEYEGEEISAYRYLVECENDDPLSSYSYSIFINSKDEIFKFTEFIKNFNNGENKLKFSSSGLDKKDAYFEFMNSLISFLYVFAFISFVGVSFIIAMFSFSNFIAHKKEAAILTCFGLRNISLIKIYTKENIYLLLIAFLLASLFIFPLEILLNNYFYNILNIKNFIIFPYLSFNNIPFALPLLILLIALLITLIFTIGPLLLYRKINLSEELKDE